MHLVYLDESGNTGKDLKDRQQPVFVLAALIVPETCWQELESNLEDVLKSFFPGKILDVAAFPLVARVVDEYLASLPGKALGMFISDENKEIVHDIEKSIKVLRGAAGTLRLKHIVEKGFFIDSKKSRVLQLCDLCALSARKKEESKANIPIKGFDENGCELIEPLVFRGNEAFIDVLAWLTQQQK